MKFFVSAALLAILAMPLGASAQQVQYPAAQPGAPATQGQQGTPRIYKRWSNLLNGLNLSDQQHTQIQTFLDQYTQAHPQGSPRDPGAQRALRDQIMGVLNTQQQSQLRDNMHQMQMRQAQRRLERLQREGQQQQPAGQPGTYPQPVTTTSP